MTCNVSMKMLNPTIPYHSRLIYNNDNNNNNNGDAADFGSNRSGIWPFMVNLAWTKLSVGFGRSQHMWQVQCSSLFAAKNNEASLGWSTFKSFAIFAVNKTSSLAAEACFIVRMLYKDIY